jgi:hypothetical protein
MDSTVILMGLGILAVCILPIFLLSKSSKNNIQKLHKLLSKEAKKSGLNFTDYDVCPELIIAFDNSQTKLLCLRKLKYDYEFDTVTLSEYASCKLKETKRIVQHNAVENQIIDNIQLVFHSNEKHKSDYVLVMYDSDTDAQITDESQIAAKWLEKINALLTK